VTNRKQRAVLIVAQIIMFSLIVVPIAGAVPTNDTLDNATLVADNDLVWTNTTGATFDAGEPAPGCNFVGDTLTWSVWFKFDATSTGTVMLEAKLPYIGGGLRQYMSIYEITSAGPPTTIGAELDCGSGQMINMQYFSVTAGKQYAVAVSGVNEYLGEPLSVEFQTTALLQGTVTDESTTNPLQGITIDILTPDTATQLNKVLIQTASDGTWEATVPTRPLVVRFRDGSSTYGTEYYDNAVALDAATTLSPLENTTVPGIDGVLSTAASLSGRVTDASGNPISGMYVKIYDAPYTGSAKSGVPTDTNGNYTFSGLSPGDYLLEFTAVGHYIEWYDNMPDPASATTVSITAGANTGYDAQLVKAARITGVVTDDLGQPISGVKVFVYDGPDSIFRSPITAADGSYTITAVPPGEYTVYADANFPVTGAYGSEWWDDLPPSSAYADVGKIAIVDGANAVANFSLNRSVLAGTVTSTDDGLPIEGVVVTVTNNVSTQLAQTTTNASGDYSFEAFLFSTPPLRVSFEATSVYFVDGQTTNVTFSAGANVTVDKALDSDQKAPTIGSGLSFSLKEDVPAGTVVGTLSGTDINRGDTLTWSITSGNTAGAFTIDSVTGAITTATALDYETTPAYLLGVALSDGSAQDTATVFVGVTDVVEGPTVQRLSGSNRYETAAAVARDRFPGAAPVVFIATADNFPDALVAAAPAGAANAPILLVSRDVLPAGTRNELQRLGPSTIYVIGGSGVVSDAVASQLATFGSVQRIFGSNRYATAAAVAQVLFPDPATVDSVFIATGINYPDALVAAAPAARDGSPILLVPGTTIPGAVWAQIRRLAPSRIYVIGGTSVVSESVVTELGSYAPVTRLAGPNRFATADAVATALFPNASTVTTLYLATAANFPDALVAAAPAGSEAGPVLLTRSNTLPAYADAQIRRLTPNEVFVIGGSAVIADTVLDIIDW